MTESLDRVSTIAHFVWRFASTPIINYFFSKISSLRVRPPLVSDAGRGLPAVELSFPVSAVLPGSPPASDSSSDSEECLQTHGTYLRAPPLRSGRRKGGSAGISR